VYLTAIEAGLTPDTIRQDAPLDVKGWKPENYTHEYFGAVTLTQGWRCRSIPWRCGWVSKSAPRTWCARASAWHCIEARDQCFDCTGTSEVSLTELVGAYTPFANGGRGVTRMS